MSKCEYEALDSYMVRESYYPFSKYAQMLEQINNENIDDTLAQLCKNAEFREAILIASESLYLDMQKYMTGEISSESKKNEIRLSLMKYWIRMSTRETPFGMFATIGLGHIEKEYSKGFKTIKKGIRADFEWLFGVIRCIELKHYTRLTYSINGIVDLKNGKVEIPYTTGFPVQRIEMAISNSMKYIFEMYKNKTFSVQETYDYVKKIGIEVSKSVFDEEIKQLIKKEILISNLRPPMTERCPLSYLVSELEASDITDGFAENLCIIETKMESYSTIPCGEGEEILKEIIAKMKELYKTEKYIQVDLMNTSERNILDKQDVKEITEFVNVFMSALKCFYDSFTIYDEYKDLFYNKYGDYREVPLLEMINANSGIGVPDNYVEAKRKIRGRKRYPVKVDLELRKYLINKFEKASRKGNIIRLDDIDKILGKNSKCERDDWSFPIGIDICLRKEIENGKRIYICNPNFGCIGAGRTLGRFAYMDNSIMEHLQKVALTEQARDSADILYCDLLYVPPRLRMGNVATNCSLCDAEMVFYTNNNGNEKIQIRLDDVFVGIHNGRFYLKSKSQNRKMQINIGNMLYYYRDCAIIRFLKEIKLDGMVTWKPETLDILNDFTHFPEIRYKSIILRAECWNISCDNNEILCDFETFDIWFAKIIEKETISKIVNLIEGDNRLLLNLRCEQHRELILQAFRRYGKVCLLRDSRGTNYEEYLHTAEVVVSMINTSHDVKGGECKKNDYGKCPERRKAIGSEWIYFRVYGITDENEFIYEELPLLIKSLDNIDGYYYIRYADPHPHIRIRIKGKNVFDNLSEILFWLEKQVKDEKVNDYEFATYERELERYGGIKGMDLAEELFMEDSKINTELYKILNASNDKYDLEFICIVSFLFYIVQFFGNMESALLWFDDVCDKNSFKAEFARCKKYYLENICYKKFVKNENARNIIRLFNSREKVVNKYKEFLVAESIQESGNQILRSILHMTFNRMWGMNGTLERKLLSYTRHIVYITVQREKHINEYLKELLWTYKE